MQGCRHYEEHQRILFVFVDFLVEARGVLLEENLTTDIVSLIIFFLATALNMHGGKVIETRINIFLITSPACLISKS